MCTIKSSGLFLFFLYSFIEGIEGLDWVALESWLYQSPAEKRADRQCRRWGDGGRGSGARRQGGMGEGRERGEGWPDERRVRHTDRCCWRIRKMYWDILQRNSFGIYVDLCNLSVGGDKQLLCFLPTCIIMLTAEVAITKGLLKQIKAKVQIKAEKCGCLCVCIPVWFSTCSSAPRVCYAKIIGSYKNVWRSKVWFVLGWQCCLCIADEALSCNTCIPNM